MFDCLIDSFKLLYKITLKETDLQFDLKVINTGKNSTVDADERLTIINITIFTLTTLQHITLYFNVQYR